MDFTSGGEQTTASAGTVSLTLKRAIEIALQNSADIRIAKIQGSLADRSAQITKAEFLPNLYAGSGAGYTYGIPETPGGRAPAIFDVTYTQNIFNEPLRGQAKELQEQAKGATICSRGCAEQCNFANGDGLSGNCEGAAFAWCCCGRNKASADKIVDVTKERQGEGFELPVEVTRAQLTRAQVVQRILQQEGREDELQVFLKSQLGLTDEQEIEVSAEMIHPGEAEQEGANLIARAMENNTGLQQAESDVRAKEFRLKGEKRGYFPTVQLVGVYSLLGRFNRNDESFSITFKRTT